jgi:hypothetical protein
MKKNILIFITSYYPNVGGAEVAVKEITDRVTNFNYHLICFSDNKKIADIEKIGNVNVHRVNGFKFLFPFTGFFKALRLNKNIEFDGEHIHKNKESDEIRDSFLKTKGYEVLRINSQDYFKNKNEIINRCLYFLNFIPNKKEFEVLTPLGFKKFDGIKKVKSLLFKVLFENGIVLECTENHLLQTSNGDKKLKDICNDEIIFLNEKTKIKNIEIISCDEEDVYDLVNVQDINRYYTNGILSHNCCDFIMSGETALHPTEIQYIKNNFICEPKDQEGTLKDFWIWSRPISGKKYIISADVGKGDSSDFSTAQVIDIDNFEQVAEYKGKIDVDRFGHLLCKWGMDYNCGLLIPENNNFGQAVIQKIIDLQYPNLFWFDKRFKGLIFPELVDRSEGKREPGWLTTSKTRDLVLENLLKLLRSSVKNQYDGITVHSSRLLGELKSWGYYGGRLDHSKGKHDDLIMALAIGAFVKSVYSRISNEVGMTSLQMMNFFSNNKENVSLAFGVMPGGTSRSTSSKNPYEFNGEDLSWLTK